MVPEEPAAGDRAAVMREGTAAPVVAGERPLRAVLVSTYELGRQPFGLASPAAWLREAGVEVTVLDLSVTRLDDEVLAQADLVAFYLPMHTATRLATRIIPAVRRSNAHAHLCAYGLYAPMNGELLRELGVATIIGGEFEAPLVELARRLRGGEDTAGADGSPVTEVSLARQRFKVPDRSDLPDLDAYAHLQLPDGSYRVVGYTEATRGCKHLCRHCPIVPVYGGRFRVVQPDVVLEDVAAQVAAGAHHVTFGDPDFLNGPAHALRVVRAFHERFPDVSYDVTVKIQHLVRHADLLPVLKETGCVLVTSAVESFDEHILDVFDKHHSRADFEFVVERVRAIGLGFNPTFVAFTPWTSMEIYVDFLETIHRLSLVGNVAPVQYAIRLLIPQGSRLLELDDTHRYLEGFDRESLCHRWRHPDPRMDALQREVQAAVEQHVQARSPREEVFADVCRLTADAADADLRVKLTELDHGPPRERIPYLTEPWYC